MKNDNIIIKSADKVGSIVIQDINDYIKEAHNILFNPKYYSILTKSASRDHIAEYTSVIKSSFENNITKK